MKQGKLLKSVFVIFMVIGVILGFIFPLTTTEHEVEHKAHNATCNMIPVLAEVTAYTEGYESTGKNPGHPAYGITYSGEPVKEWHTAAGSESLPIGTRVYIPYFADKPNGGIFVITDRGGLIRDGGYKHNVDVCIDVYMKELRATQEFGRKVMTVYILKEG